MPIYHQMFTRCQSTHSTVVWPLCEAAKDADLLIFVVFGDEMEQLMQKLKGKVKPTATAVVSWM